MPEFRNVFKWVNPSGVENIYTHVVGVDESGKVVKHTLAIKEVVPYLDGYFTNPMGGELATWHIGFIVNQLNSDIYEGYVPFPSEWHGVTLAERGTE